MTKKQAKRERKQGQRTPAEIARQDDPGAPGGGQGRVDITGKSDWTPPEGNYPPGEGYEESGRSGVISPDRFAEQKTERPAKAKG